MTITGDLKCNRSLCFQRRHSSFDPYHDKDGDSGGGKSEGHVNDGDHINGCDNNSNDVGDVDNLDCDVDDHNDVDYDHKDNIDHH